jgi:SAM-dependent methyltransferase
MTPCRSSTAVTTTDHRSTPDGCGPSRLGFLRADVLDLGCGCGVPVSRELTVLRHKVVGVDLSDRQVERARRLVPQARFIRADATEISFENETFDAIVCLYMLIHVPLDRQERLLRRMRDWLRPGGVLLATVGARAWSGHEDDWLGSGAPMWWSHADAASYRRWLTAAGFAIDEDEFVPEGDSGHQMLIASASARESSEGSLRPS